MSEKPQKSGHPAKRGRIGAFIDSVRTAVLIEGGLLNTFRTVLFVLRNEGLVGLSERVGGALSKSGRTNYQEWVRRYDTLTDTKRDRIRKKSGKLAHKPLISVLMPTYNTPLAWLEEAVDSVCRQLYGNWELCIADDASTVPRVREFLESASRKDQRIKVVFREKNGHISAASNTALELCEGEWIALMDHDDVLAEHALYCVAEAINRHPEARLIYSDEDKISERGFRFEPYFKCDWNRDLFYSHNMICHLGVYRREVVQAVGGFREGLEGAQDYDLALRVVEKISREQIVHIPRVIYHWRCHSESTSSGNEAKPYAIDAGARAISEHMVRSGISACVESSPDGYYVQYQLPSPQPLVTIVIPTRNGLHLLKKCIEGIEEKTTYRNFEILIVDNGSDDPAILDYFSRIQEKSRIRVIRDDRPFNFGALNNSAVDVAEGEYVALVNNDIEVIAPDWLSEMVGLASQPGVGVVGAKLLYSDGTIQHAGVVLGIGGVAGHAFKRFQGETPGYFNRAILVSSFSALTAACFVVRKSTFQQVGGFDEENLAIAFNDVDFCLRVREAGFRNVWTPHALLFHHESATRGYEDTEEKRARFAREVRVMKKRWGEKLLTDPAYSPNLTLEHEDFSYAWPPRAETL